MHKFKKLCQFKILYNDGECCDRSSSQAAATSHALYFMASVLALHLAFLIDCSIALDQVGKSLLRYDLDAQLLKQEREERRHLNSQLSFLFLSPLFQVLVAVSSVTNKTTMVYGVIRNFQAALKYRGGWKGLLEHMYTVSDDRILNVAEM